MIHKSIYIIRHGETDLNTRRILQGKRVDYPINKKGITQSDLFFEQYKNIPFKKIYLSTMKRSFESVEKFIHLGIPYASFEELNEIDYGVHDGITSSAEESIPYNELTSQWKKGKLDVKFEEGESPLEVAERIKTITQFILNQKDEDTILICMHGRVMRILLTVLLNIELDFMNLFDHSNMGLYIVNFCNSIACLEKHNDTSHLIGMNNIHYS